VYKSGSGRLCGCYNELKKKSVIEAICCKDETFEFETYSCRDHTETHRKLSIALMPILMMQILNLIFKCELIDWLSECYSYDLMSCLRKFVILIRYIFSVIKKLTDEVYCEICISHFADHGDYFILGFDAMLFDRWVPLWWRNVLPVQGQWWRDHIPTTFSCLSSKLLCPASEDGLHAVYMLTMLLRYMLGFTLVKHRGVI
jgi:hypothetical protein